MERISSKKVVAPLAPATVYNVDFVIPSGMLRWSLHIVPKNNDGVTPAPDASTFRVLYAPRGTFYATEPAGSGTLTRNADNVVTRADAISVVRLEVTTGATPSDGDLEVDLYGTRES